MKTLTQNARYMVLSDNMRIAIRYSFFVALAYTLIFIIARVAHLEGKTGIRFLNYLVLFPIVYSALGKSYKLHQNKIEYFSGFSMAFLIGAMGQLWFSIFFFIYLHIDPSIIPVLTAPPFPRDLLYPEVSLSFILLVEGVAISIICALATMQYFKRKRGRWASTNQ